MNDSVYVLINRAVFMLRIVTSFKLLTCFSVRLFSLSLLPKLNKLSTLTMATGC